MKPGLKLGLENFTAAPPESIRGKRIGLLANSASTDRYFNHALHLINEKLPGQLKVLFSPQHGFSADKQDNMIESRHGFHQDLKIPIYSLYSETRIPTREMFENIDTLVVDLQDVGTRVYTFIYTVSYCLEAAAEMNKKVIILDRPNPIDGIQIEGNILSENCTSFVGRFPIPMRHGLTIGEISSLFNTESGISCDLEIIPMTGWKRILYWHDTGLPWISPSPNLPTADSCLVYPGQVIFEGTNISEGRGTALPFEQFGAPFLDTGKIKKHVQPLIKGAVLRNVNFEPTSNKWQGKTCRGFQIHVTSKRDFKPYLTSLLLLQAIIRFHKSDFELKKPPYEYDYESVPLDLILGSRTLRKKIMALENIEELSSAWDQELEKFRLMSKQYYLYD